MSDIRQNSLHLYIIFVPILNTKPIIKFISILFLCITISGNSQEVSSFFTKADAFLKENVSNGKVDYQAIKSDNKLINELVAIIAAVDLSQENKSTQKAFLINAYNILLIKSILTKYPVKSPMDITGLFDKSQHTLGGKKYTLNDIENKLIRAEYNDARIHFVLVCGALGCPPIINGAYKPGTLEEQLDKQSKIALNNPNFIKINAGSKKVELSQIFEWYKGDFVSKGKNEIAFINQFRESKIDEKSKISYYTYDWTLNKK